MKLYLASNQLTTTSYALWEYLNTGLGNGLEGWNGLLNGLWNFCVQKAPPFHTVFQFLLSLSTLSNARRVSSITGKATSYVHLLKLIQYAYDI